MSFFKISSVAPRLIIDFIVLPAVTVQIFWPELANSPKVHTFCDNPSVGLTKK